MTLTEGFVTLALIPADLSCIGTYITGMAFWERSASFELVTIQNVKACLIRSMFSPT